jgi:hypothetical protein
MQRHAGGIVDAVTELHDLGLVENAHAEIRLYPAVPLFKLYVINVAEVFFGYYPVEKHHVTLDGERTPMWDLMGKDAVLFHHAADVDPESLASQYVAQSCAWFDSLWDTVARPLTP